MVKKRFAYLFGFLVSAYTGIYLGFTLDIPILEDLPLFVQGLLAIISFWAILVITYFIAKDLND